MEPRPAKKERTSGERLRRVGQQKEGYLQRTEQPLESLIVLGASAGGYHALQEAIKGLSRDIPAAIVILLHSSSSVGLEHQLVNVLRQSTELPTRAIQEDGDRLEPGRIYVTPPGTSVFLQKRIMRLERLRPVHPVTTINRLFESAAKTYHDRVIGVILSGLLRDGTAGLKAVHEAGGLTIVQDPAEAEYPDMPQNAMRDLPVTFCLRLAEIGPALDLLARRGTELESGLAASVRMLKERVELLQRLLIQSTHIRSTHEFLTAELITLQQYLHATQTLLNETLSHGEDTVSPV